MYYEKKQNSIADSPLKPYRPVVLPLLKDYLKEFTRTGYLFFQIYQESPIYGQLPVENAKITLCKEIGNEIYICKVIYTNVNGETKPLPLPTVSAELSRSPGSVITNAVYDISVEAPSFYRYEKTDIPVFEGITSIQSVVLSPVIEQTLPPNQHIDEKRGESIGNNQQAYRTFCPRTDHRSPW